MTSPCQRSHRIIKQWTIFTISCLIFISLASCGSQPPSLPLLISPTGTFAPSLSPTEILTQTPYIITATSQVKTPQVDALGIFFLAMADAGHIHIFAYSPQTLSFTRLTNGDWDDISPAISPDGRLLAFASNRNGYWNIYSLDLQNGAMFMLSDSLEYKGNPSWSSDGAWVTYDSYVNGNLKIFLCSTTDIKQPPTQLTTQAGSLDSSPAWSPQGRQIAFISDRSGEPEVGVTNLDVFGSFTDVSLNPHAVESHPTWSPDGSQLAWAATDDSSGLTGIYLWDSRDPGTPARWVGSGNWPVWQDSGHLASLLFTPNQFFLTAFSTSGNLSLPPILLPGPVEGLAYGNITMSLPGPFEGISRMTPSPLYDTILNPQADGIPGRSSLAPLSGVQAPYPQLHELADDSFQALRNQVAVLTGWDALASLENAFVPLTIPLDPGLGEDWLYTGRAFTLNPSLIDAGWMAIVREDFGQQTYWRIYLRTTAQDGSEGLPLAQIPWDFSARSGDPVAYENGGRLMASIPSGYWLDLTMLALQYGWERLPALTNWRTYYSGARFNELAFTQGLDWRSAMLQLYPPDVLVTPTVVIPPTRTPTRTPPFYRSPTPTQTATHRPTRTP